MAFYVLLALVGLACLRGLLHWRDGLFGIVLIAAVQDPLRKLVPEAPGYLVLASVPILLVAVLALVISTRSWWTGFGRVFPRIDRAVRVFAVACVPAAALSAFFGPGSWMLTLLGALSYSVLFLAVILGFHFLRGVKDLRRFLGFYCAASAIMLTGTIAEHLGIWPDWQVLGTSALGHEWIRHAPGYQVQMISGFYRSPDVMGWHAATTVMVATVLVLAGRAGWRWPWVAVAAVGLIALMLCGRRKMVYMLPLFASVLIVLVYAAAWRGRRLIGTTLALAVPLAAGLMLFDRLIDADDANVVRYYTETADQALDRLEVHGFRSLMATYQQTGFFGSGLGVATPGSHHLDVARPFVWQESGPSRVLVELGVLGTAAFAALLGNIVFAAWQVTRWHLRTRSMFASYSAGLFAFFIANAGSLMVSGQILADPAVASFLGLSIGFVLSFGRPSIVAQARVRRRNRSGPRDTPCLPASVGPRGMAHAVPHTTTGPVVSA